MKHFLFDFDGTLVDSMPIYVSSMLRILDENGISYGSDIVKIITPMGTEKSADYYVSLGVPKTREEIILLMKKYMLDAYFYTIPAKENVISTLKALKEEKHQLCVLTASPHITLDACLKRLGIYDLFDEVWSCDDFATSKADPEIYRRAAEKMGVSVGDVLFLDDNLGACTTAKEAGMKVCGVFDESSAEYEEEMRALTDCYIRDFSELLSI